jgi:hypothetical protein
MTMRLDPVVNWQSAVTIVIGFTMLACGEEVQLLPTIEACLETEEAKMLPGTEFVELIGCHYPPGDGWRLLTLRGVSFTTSDQDVGRGWWAATVAQVDDVEVWRVVYSASGFTQKELDGSDLEGCGPDDRLDWLDSPAIIADAVARWGSGSWEAGPDLRATHACVAGGTCGRAVVMIGDWVSKYYVYSLDGTYLPDYECDSTDL